MRWSDPLAEAVKRAAPKGITAAIERYIRLARRQPRFLRGRRATGDESAPGERREDDAGGHA